MDLNAIIESDDKGKEKEEEEVKGATKTRADPVSTKEMAPEEAIEVETTMEIITEAVVDTKAMTSEAVKDFEATLASAPGE